MVQYLEMETEIQELFSAKEEAKEGKARDDLQQDMKEPGIGAV